MRHLKTNRLFFKKWLYKVNLYEICADLVKSWGIPAVIKYLPDSTCAELADAIRQLNFTAEYEMRARFNSLAFYTNDRNLHECLAARLARWVTYSSAPANQASADIILNGAGSITICKHYPFHKFQYKVQVKRNIPFHIKQSFTAWAVHYVDTIHIPAHTVTWLCTNSSRNGIKYMYVHDINVLTLVMLYLGNYITHYEKYEIQNAPIAKSDKYTIKEV